MMPRALRQDLLKQDCASPSSFTWAVTRQVDPFHDIRTAAGTEPDLGHPHLARMLEWAYGYRADGTAGRRAPSAGGLYPCELITVEYRPSGWRTFLYDFECQRRIWLPTADAGGLARSMRLGKHQAAIVAVAALWRTVQRYGARGYRYCALDAGHVLGSLWRVASATGGRASWYAPPGRHVSALLGLPYSVVALAIGVFDISAIDVPQSPRTDHRRNSGDAGIVEETPLISPQLLRAQRFHERAEASVAALLEPPLAATGPDLFSSLETRRSAKDFLATHPEDMPPVAMAAVTEYLSDRGMRGAGKIIALTGDGAARRPAVAFTQSDLRRVCQSQDLVARATAAFLFTGPRPGCKNGGFDHAEFLRSCLFAGMVSSELYRLASSLGLASTMIGGFLDSEILDACRPGGHPLAFQVFGRTAPGSKRKVDAALATVTRA
jgi:Nitroreductase family